MTIESASTLEARNGRCDSFEEGRCGVFAVAEGRCCAVEVREVRSCSFEVVEGRCSEPLEGAGISADGGDGAASIGDVQAAPAGSVGASVALPSPDGEAVEGVI